MELRHLRYFIAVAADENLSRAALKLHVSQPAISRQIRDLEEELGFPLFKRTGKSIALTGAGKTFLAEARSVLQHLDNAVQSARAIATKVTAELRLGYAPSLTAKILPVALRDFQARFPAVRVTLRDLSSAEMLAGLRADELHVALTIKPSHKLRADMIFVPLSKSSMCVAVAPKHPLALHKSASLDEIARQPLIGYSREDYPDYYEILDCIFAGSGRAPRVIEEHDGLTSIITAVESGRGIALVAESFACFTGPRLKLLALKPSPTPIEVGALWKKGKNPLADHFVAAAAEELHESR
jgi:LysR family transcriptional regulator, benzoate and cis,cis-muconate-responsive activator of ben and cat genes